MQVSEMFVVSFLTLVVFVLSCKFKKTFAKNIIIFLFLIIAQIVVFYWAVWSEGSSYGNAGYKVGYRAGAMGMPDLFNYQKHRCSTNDINYKTRAKVVSTLMGSNTYIYPPVGEPSAAPIILRPGYGGHIDNCLTANSVIGGTDFKTYATSYYNTYTTITTSLALVQTVVTSSYDPDLPTLPTEQIKRTFGAFINMVNEYPRSIFGLQYVVIFCLLFTLVFFVLGCTWEKGKKAKNIIIALVGLLFIFAQMFVFSWVVWSEGNEMRHVGFQVGYLAGEAQAGKKDTQCAAPAQCIEGAVTR